MRKGQKVQSLASGQIGKIYAIYNNGTVDVKFGKHDFECLPLEMIKII